jgi:protein-L-isoaspartate(D-aspartate) O-methyltransferase
VTEIATAIHDPADAARLRDKLTNALIADGWITSPEVEAAFRRVPRHAFAPPGTTLEGAYADDVIRTRFDPGGTCLSSVSAPWLQAAMISQAEVEPGMRVLEVGSGGYNAALLAEVAGPDGHVVTIDIDPGVTDAAAAALDAAGYGDRVTVITGDAEHGVPQHAPFDAVIVTAGAWDIAPAWISQLAPDSGALVVPLRMNGWTRSIAFRRHGDHLASTSAQVCGFVPMQGGGALVEQAAAFNAPDGMHVLIRSEDPAFGDPPLPWDLLAGGPITVWSGITIANMTSFADLYLWLGAFADGACKITAEDGNRLPGDPSRPGRYPAAVIHGGSLACLITRKLSDADSEFGACAYGPRAAQAAATLLRHIKDWDCRDHDLPGTAFAYWPASTTPAPIGPGPAGVFPKRHGTATITWPPPRPAAQTPADRVGE